MPLDAANAAYLERLRHSGIPGVRDVPLPEFRAILSAAQAKRAQGPAVAAIENLAIDTAGGPLPVRLYVPHGTPQGAIIYLHGGGWVAGDVQGWDALCRLLANQAACVVLSVDYRLAPEHRFPAALEDVRAALGWAAQQLPVRLGRPLPLIIAGDSAGANLAAAATLLVRDEGGPALAMQVLAYPVVEADTSIPSLAEFVPPRLSREELAWYVEQYVPPGERRTDPRISPLRAASLAGLPPAFVLTAEDDILRGQGEAYAARLLEAGVPVMARRYLGTMHGFMTMGDSISQSGEAVRDVAGFIASTLARCWRS